MARIAAPNTAAAHKEAFEIYARTQNFTKVSEEMGETYSLILSWAKEGYRCQFACPFHNWPELLKERTKVLSTQVSLLENKVDDAEVRRVVAESQVNKTPQKLEVKNSLLKVVKSDLERLAQLEVLYNKTYFALTGIPLAVGEMELGEHKIHLEEMYSQGMNPGDWDSGLKSLDKILTQIDNLKKRLGLVAEAETANPNNPEKPPEDKPVTIAELLKIKQRLADTDPGTLAVLASQVRKEEQALEVLTTNG